MKRFYVSQRMVLNITMTIEAESASEAEKIATQKIGEALGSDAQLSDVERTSHPLPLDRVQETKNPLLDSLE